MLGMDYYIPTRHSLQKSVQKHYSLRHKHYQMILPSIFLAMIAEFSGNPPKANLPNFW